ncbi:MAG: cytochrome c, partial [Sphingomonas sp.]
DPALAAGGKATFAAHCAICHGPAAVSGGAAPDLRRAGAPLNRDAFASLLRDGLLVERGMPKFDDLSAAGIDGLQHYIRQQARMALATGGSPQAAEKIAQDARRLHADQ